MCDPAVLNMYNNPNNHWMYTHQPLSQDGYAQLQQQQQQQHHQLVNQPVYYPGLAHNNFLPVPTY